MNARDIHAQSRCLLVMKLHIFRSVGHRVPIRKANIRNLTTFMAVEFSASVLPHVSPLVHYSES